MRTVIERPLAPSLETLFHEARVKRASPLPLPLRFNAPGGPCLPSDEELARLLKLPRIAGAAAGAWTFPNGARTRLLNGTFDLDSDTFKMALFLSTSNLGAATTTYAGVTNEHANANGYTTGGNAITISLSGTTTVTVDGTDVSWTAAGGSIVARFAAIYEVGGDVLCYCLLDSTPADVTVTDGNQLTVAIHASGIFTLA